MTSEELKTVLQKDFVSDNGITGHPSNM